MLKRIDRSSIRHESMDKDNSHNDDETFTPIDVHGKRFKLKVGGNR